MSHLRHCLILLLLVLISVSCAPQKTLVFFAEAYWWKVLGQNADFDSTIRRLAYQNGYSFSLIVAPPGANYPEFLKKNISEKPGDLVFAGPLLASDILRLAPLYPEKRFAILAAPRLAEELPGNVILVPVKQGNAFFEAGKLAGKAINSRENPVIGRKVGVILTGLAQEEKEMLKEFERGFSLFEEAENIIVVEIGTTTDKVKATLAVENLLGRNVKLFLVKTYGLNGTCLDKIVNSGGFFIIEDYKTFNLYPEKLFLSIEDNYGKALSEILKRDQFGPEFRPIIEADVIEGETLQRMKTSGR